MLEGNHTLSDQNDQLAQSCQIIEEWQFRGQSGRQQNEVDYYHPQEYPQHKSKENYQNSFAYDEDDLQSITKESCMTGINSSMEIEPRQLLSEKTKKKKTDRLEGLRNQLLEAIQSNEHLQERLVLLESLFVQTSIKLSQLQQRMKLRLLSKRKYSL